MEAKKQNRDYLKRKLFEKWSVHKWDLGQVRNYSFHIEPSQRKEFLRAIYWLLILKSSKMLSVMGRYYEEGTTWFKVSQIMKISVLRKWHKSYFQYKVKKNKISYCAFLYTCNRKFFMKIMYQTDVVKVIKLCTYEFYYSPYWNMHITFIYIYVYNMHNQYVS